MSRKKRLDRRRRRRERTKQGKGLFGKIKKALKGAGNVLTFPALIPFKIAMSKILKSKGVKPEKKIGKLAQQFHNVVILKKSSFETYEPEHLFPEAIQAIVKAVFDFFDKLKKKKEDGKELTPAEDKALEFAEKATENVINPIEEAAKEAAIEKTKSKTFIPIAVIAAIAILLLLMRKK